MKQILTILILALTIKAYSCDCFTLKTNDALRSYDVVFVGRIIEYHDSTKLYSANPYIGQVKFYNFEIIRYFKGLTKLNKIISLVENGNNCDIQFNHYFEGDTFLVYANLNGENFNNHLLSTSICSRTKLVSEITEKEELDIYKNFSLWKYPENIEQIAIKDTPLYNSVKGDKINNNFSIILASVLILLNLTIIILLVKRRK